MTDGLEQVDVAIVGGGIGGLTAAVALNKAGIKAHLFEQAPAFGQVGGHLTLDTAAIEVLARWGLDGHFREMAVELNGIEVRHIDTGEVIAAFPIPDLGSMGVADPNRKGSRVVHAFLRADYLKWLTSLVPQSQLHLGNRLKSLEDVADGAIAEFENGKKVKAKYIIGADGVRSMARNLFDPAETLVAPVSVARTMCPVSALPADIPNDRMRFFDGWAFGDKEANHGTHVLTAPVRGGAFICVDYQLHGGDQLQDCNPWDVPAERIAARLPKETWGPVRALLDARVEVIATHPLQDRPVASKWTSDHIAIIGDAAHAMRPTLGQGACQSIHDVGQLLKDIEAHGLSTAALKAYEAVRAPYVRSIVDVAKNTKVDPKAWKKKIEEEA